MSDTVRQHHRRLAVFGAMVILALVIAASDPLHDAVQAAIDRAAPFIARHAVIGAIVFVLIAALSAMVIFLSAAVITPVAVDAFGAPLALVLLWIGWIGGGLTAYAIGRFFGRRVVSWFVEPRKLREYERSAKRLASFRHVLLFQLAVPSEVPGYVLGLARCRFRTFALAMALGELPFAIGAVYLGQSFLERNYPLLIGIGSAGVLFSWLVLRSYREARQRAMVRLVVNDRDGRDRGGDEAEVLAHAEVHGRGRSDERPHHRDEQRESRDVARQQTEDAEGEDRRRAWRTE